MLTMTPIGSRLVRRDAAARTLSPRGPPLVAPEPSEVADLITDFTEEHSR